MSARPIATTRSAAEMPTGKLAVWWIIASEIVIFGGLLGAYVMFRLRHAEGFGADASHTNVVFGTVNTLILLTSSLSAVLAHQAAEQGNGKKAAQLLMATTLGGAGFLIVKTVEWTSEISLGYTITASPFWSFYYTAAGLHAFHVIAGMVIMCFVAATARRNEELHRVELIGIYWHFVDVVWIFLFPLLYIAK